MSGLTLLRESEGQCFLKTHVRIVVAISLKGINHSPLLHYLYRLGLVMNVWKHDSSDGHSSCCMHLTSDRFVKTCSILLASLVQAYGSGKDHEAQKDQPAGDFWSCCIWHTAEASLHHNISLSAYWSTLTLLPCCLSGASLRLPEARAAYRADYACSHTRESASMNVLAMLRDMRSSMCPC